jgi:predicted nucleic acid-binding protein
VNGYLVDTNIPSELTREKPDVRVATFLRSAGQSRVFLSVMTIGEICKGIAALPLARGAPDCKNGLIPMFVHGLPAAYCQSRKR